MKLRLTVDGETADVSVERILEPALPRDIMMVITAAVSAVLEGRPFRIRSVYPGGPNPGSVHAAGAAAWTQLGRQQIQTSHSFERKFR